jgi:hypothetical protein
MPEIEFERPAAGSFDTAALSGRYKFGACTTAGKPIWSDGPEGSFLFVDDQTDYATAGSPRMIHLMRATYANPMAIGFDLEHFGAGPQESEEDGRIVRRAESYATADGVFGYMAWDNGSAGWIAIRLWKDAVGGLHYRLRQRWMDEPAAREESCALILSPVSGRLISL